MPTCMYTVLHIILFWHCREQQKLVVSCGIYTHIFFNVRIMRIKFTFWGWFRNSPLHFDRIVMHWVVATPSNKAFMGLAKICSNNLVRVYSTLTSYKEYDMHINMTCRLILQLCKWHVSSLLTSWIGIRYL